MTLREMSTRNEDNTPLDVPQLPSIDKFRGCLLGCALGDVVGAWAERRPSAEARDFAENCVRQCNFSKIGTHHNGMPFGQYTDDTQLTRELMLSLIDEGAWVPEDFAERVARIFAREGVVGFGGATLEAAQRLQAGVLWSEAGTPLPRAGNGAAMRATPLGLFFWHDIDALVSATQEQAIITHTAPMSIAGAVAVAVVTAMCLNASSSTSGPHEIGWWQWLARFVEKDSEEYATDIRELINIVFKGRKESKRRAPGDDDERRAVAKWVLKDDDPRWSGVSPWARTSVLWSLYCLMTHPNDPWAAIELAVWVGGDSDTIAAMAGAMVGANAGIDAFPEKVVTDVVPLIHDIKTEGYDWEGLDQLVYHLYACVVGRYNERLADAAEQQIKHFEALIEQSEDESEQTQLRGQMQAVVDCYMFAKAEAPEYTRPATPVLFVEDTRETENEDEGSVDILSMFGSE